MVYLLNDGYRINNNTWNVIDRLIADYKLYTTMQVNTIQRTKKINNLCHSIGEH